MWSRYALLGIEIVLVGLALAAGVWTVLVVAEARVYERYQEEALARAAHHGAIRATRQPNHGDPLGRLDMPRLHMSTVVVEGTSMRALRLGAGHVEGTSWPGEPGNIAIAGHRDTVFRALRSARVGDEIRLTTDGGAYIYRIASVRVVGPDAVDVLDETPGKQTLTLVTCYPFFFLGHAPKRFIVRAERVTDTQQTNP
jgi:LPXTG-site transpeptidase (sortase) family protein